jgi:hypothetical protein
MPRMSPLTLMASGVAPFLGKTLEGLLVWAVFYCIFAAAVRREKPFGPVLTHFDEAAAYAVIARLAAWTS